MDEANRFPKALLLWRLRTPAPCNMSRFLACAVLTLAASTASAVPIPSTAAAAAAPAHEHRAWAALLTGNSENMTTLALVQVASLRRFSAHKKQ